MSPFVVHFRLNDFSQESTCTPGKSIEHNTTIECMFPAVVRFENGDLEQNPERSVASKAS